METPSSTRSVSLSILSRIVRPDLEIGKFTTTQELFLQKVGISNSYSEDNLTLVTPFFVRPHCEIKVIRRGKVFSSST